MKINNKEQLRQYFCENEIKLVALDLDRTTLRSDSTLAPRTKAAIEAVIALGVEVVVISGRPRCSLPQDILEIKEIRYLVTSNGAAVNLRSLQSGEIKEKRIWAWTLKEESAIAIFEITEPYYEMKQITYETFVEGTAYAPRSYVNCPTKFGVPQKAVPYVQGTRIPVDDFPSFIRAHARELDSFDIIVGDAGCFHSLKTLLQKDVPDVYMTSSMERMIEISHRDAGKGSGMCYVLQSLGISEKHALAFGDGDNDADMLECAGIGVAMENAMPLCREKADYVSTSNDDYGVAVVLELLADTMNREKE